MQKLNKKERIKLKNEVIKSFIHSLVEVDIYCFVENCKEKAIYILLNDDEPVIGLCDRHYSSFYEIIED